MCVLGLDPGTERTGYGCVRATSDGAERLASGVLHLGKSDLPQRLAQLHLELCRLFETYRPESCAIEGVFHHRNARSALVLGHARGVCLLAAASHGVPVVEYAPAAVKRALVGNGAADKQQVGYMVQRLLGFQARETLDETDALAVALCHLEAQRPLPLTD